MNWSDLLFSFRGRVNRAKYWLVAILFTAIFSVVAGAIFVYSQTVPAFIVIGILFLVAFYISMAISAKRLHDRDKSGWWLLVFYGIPAVLNGIGELIGGAALYVFYIAAMAIYIWAFVELGCLRGTVGPNRYGPDPLAKA
jgi:uncharacterized membrane protein YhaH (DUF805 family)